MTSPVSSVTATTGPERYSDLFAHEADNEFERLQVLAEELDEGTFRCLEALQPRPDWRCLEIGAGLGTVSRWLAQRCPDGQVVATDLSSRYLGHVGRHNLQVVQHDVTVDDFPAASFDLIVSRFVFSHVRSREQELARVSTWLAPGGWLVLEEPARFPLTSSPDPLFRKVMLAAMDGFAAVVGTDTDWARTFPRPLARLGLERLGLDGSLLIGGPGSPIARFWAMTVPRVREHIVSTGRATEDEVKQAMDQMFAEGFADVTLASMRTWGRRPKVGNRRHLAAAAKNGIGTPGDVP